MERMMGYVLAPGGSSPCIDNEPYELYHVGAPFVAALLGQALLAMDVSDEAGRAACGAAVDLLLWIRKWATPQAAGDMRPLQLPTCFRRLTGAALCGPNILAAFRHLSRDRWTSGLATTSWWNEFLGGAGPALEAYVESFPDEGLARVPAVVFEEQSKACEKLSRMAR